MNYVYVNSINKIGYLHPPPETSILNKHFNKDLNREKEETENKYKLVKYKTNENITIKNENKYAYSLIWKGIHYVSNFLNSIPGEEVQTENAFIVFIKCISELLPNEEYSRHMKEFINKYPLDNLKTTTEKFKWSYKLHSYINFMRFVKNLKYYIFAHKKHQVEMLLNNYCVSLEFNKQQINTCMSYINNKIKMIMNDKNQNIENSFQGVPNGTENIEDYIFVENISYQEALKKYTITDTNIITKNDWGPAIWMMIHFFAANLKKEKINIYVEFINTLMYVIPCEECRKHLRENIKKIPLYINNKSNNISIFEWSCNLHNLVNQQLKKPVHNLCNTLFYKYLDNYNSTYDYI